jgi:hypothetical protein
VRFGARQIKGLWRCAAILSGPQTLAWVAAGRARTGTAVRVPRASAANVAQIRAHRLFSTEEAPAATPPAQACSFFVGNTPPSGPKRWQHSDDRKSKPLISLGSALSLPPTDLPPRRVQEGHARGAAGCTGLEVVQRLQRCAAFHAVDTKCCEANMIAALLWRNCSLPCAVCAAATRDPAQPGWQPPAGHTADAACGCR